MSKIPKLAHTLQRFNQGCSFYKKALVAWETGDSLNYESYLRTAATETIGALEWTLKIYLRNIRRSVISSEDFIGLRQPNFDDLMRLMAKYADPTLAPEIISNLYDYREQLRNAGEHNASVPARQDLGDSIRQIRSLIITYLPVSDVDIVALNDDLHVNSQIENLRIDYFAMLRDRFNYMDLGGISPRVGSKIVKIRMEDLFIPLQVIEADELFDELQDEGQLDYLVAQEPDLTLFDDAEGDTSESDNLVNARTSTSRYAGLLERRPSSLSLSSILSSPKLVILGHPGSGKTTVGKFVAYSLSTNKYDVVGKHLEGFVPVLFKASEYASIVEQNGESFSVFGFLTQFHTDKYGDLIRWGLENKSCLVIIDGLDEISDPRLRTLTSRKIEQFVSEFQGNHFVITSRIVGYAHNQLSGEFVHVRVREFSQRQVKKFLENWYLAIENEADSQIGKEQVEKRATDLLESINSNPGVSKLASNPLLLTIIALANWRGTKLPNRRVELYQIASETLIENWPLKQRGLSLDFEEILKVLEPIAYEIFKCGSNNSITQRELSPLFEKQVCEVRGASFSEARLISRQMLQTIEVDTGFFLQKGHDQSGNRVYGFLHLTFAEYLTARYLAEQWSGGTLDISEMIHDPQWHEVLLLMTGHVGTWSVNLATKLTEDILNSPSEYESLLHRNLLLVSEILSDNVRVLRRFLDEILQRLIDIVLTTPHMSLWNQATEMLSQIIEIFGGGTVLTQLDTAHGDSEEIRTRKASVRMQVNKSDWGAVNEVLSSFLRLGDVFWISSAITRLASSLSRSARSNSLFVIQDDRSIQFIPIAEEVITELEQMQIPISGLEDLKNEMLMPNESRRLWILKSSEISRLELSEIIDLLLADGKTPISLLVAAIFNISPDGLDLILESLMQRAFEDNQGNFESCILATLELVSGPFNRMSRGKIEHWIDQLKRVYYLDQDDKFRALALRLLYMIEIPEKDLEFVESGLLDSSPDVRLAALDIFPYRSDFMMSNYEKLKKLLCDEVNEISQIAARRIIRLNKFTESEIDLLFSKGFSGSTRDEDIGNRRLRGSGVTELVLLLKRTSTMDLANTICEAIASLAKNEDFYMSPYGFPVSVDSVLFSSSENEQNYRSMLFDLMNGSNSNVRANAFRLWNQTIEGGDLPNGLCDFLLDPDPEIVVSALQLLRPFHLDDTELVRQLLTNLNDTDAIAEAAAKVLGGGKHVSQNQFILQSVVDLLREHPDHKHAYQVLWDLVVITSGGRWDDIPF